jgi:hypothetical protein
MVTYVHELIAGRRKVKSAIGQCVKVPVAAAVVLGQTIKLAEHQGFTLYH